MERRLLREGLQPSRASNDPLLVSDLRCVLTSSSPPFAFRSLQDFARKLFATFSKLPIKVQLAMLDPSKPSPSSLNPLLPTLLRRAQVRLSGLRRQRNLVDFLPPELLSSVGRYLVGETGSSDVSFKLCAVSRR